MLWLCSKKWRSANTMTTQTLISDGLPLKDSVSINDIVSQGVAALTAQQPAGFPDEATLARLANAMFSAIPGVLENAGIVNAANVKPAALNVPAQLPVNEIRFDAIDHGALPASPPQVPSSSPENRILPHSSGLPGQASLQQILGELAGDKQPAFT